MEVDLSFSFAASEVQMCCSISTCSLEYYYLTIQHFLMHLCRGYNWQPLFHWSSTLFPSLLFIVSMLTFIEI